MHVNYTIDITPCRLQTVTVPTQPNMLVLDRAYDANNIVDVSFRTQYKSLMVLSHSECPVLWLNFTNPNLASVGVNLPNIAMINLNNPDTATVKVKNDQPFTEYVLIDGYSLTSTAQMNATIRVCGAETIALVST